MIRPWAPPSPDRPMFSARAMTFSEKRQAEREEAVEGAGGDHRFGSAETGDDALPGLAALASVFDDLQVGVFAAGFFPNEHGVLCRHRALTGDQFKSMTHIQIMASLRVTKTCYLAPRISQDQREVVAPQRFSHGNGPKSAPNCQR